MTFPQKDPRKYFLRFQGENFYKNLELVNQLNSIAMEKVPLQFSLPWPGACKGYVPIPGSRKVKYPEQNIGATNISISPEEMQSIEGNTLTGKVSTRQ